MNNRQIQNQNEVKLPNKFQHGSVTFSSEISTTDKNKISASRKLRRMKRRLLLQYVQNSDAEVSSYGSVGSEESFDSFLNN